MEGTMASFRRIGKIKFQIQLLDISGISIYIPNKMVLANVTDLHYEIFQVIIDAKSHYNCMRSYLIQGQQREAFREKFLLFAVSKMTIT